MSRKIEIENGDPIEARGLSRGQLKKLKKDGIDPANLNKENADDILDAVFDMALNEEDRKRLEDDLPYKISMQVWIAILKETYGAPDEEKNSSRSGPGTQTQSA